MTLDSNSRWCSDAFEIKCFSGDKVYVTFSLDCSDREAIHFVATTEPLTQSHISEFMIFSFDERFPKGRATRKIQWLAERGSIYRAQLGHDPARIINLEPCYTAASSPSSNGMAEVFVGMMKRDYVYSSDCYDAETVLKMLPEWFEDYNSEAPHSALQMMSPQGIYWQKQLRQLNRSPKHRRGLMIFHLDRSRLKVFYRSAFNATADPN